MKMCRCPLMLRPGTGGAWTVIILLLAFPLLAGAQSGDKSNEPKLDTVVEDTITVGGDAPVARTHVDTSYSASPESGNTPASKDASPSLRHLPDSTVRHWQGDPDFAYANDSAYWKVHPQKPNPVGLWLAHVVSGAAFSYIVLILLAGLLLFAIIRIAMENNGLFSRRRAAKSSAVGDDAGDLPEEEDLNERIQFFLNTGDKRQATRYLYLKTLHLLSDRGLIRWHVQATNQEYLRQLKGGPSEVAFRFLTRAYEMVWYGEFIPSESSFRRLHEHFTDLYKTLGA
jgi:Domain of unknown function (DUF4129)